MLTPSDFERAYLAADDARAQSGFHGDEARWEAARRSIVAPVDRPGTFLDVGCANGLLLESVVRWSPHALQPFGIDFAPRIVDLARDRLPQWADRLWVADAREWEPPERFDFVHVRVELLHANVASFGRRLIVSSDGSFRRPESLRAQPVAPPLRALGLRVRGSLYRRSDEHLVEVAVAWTDQE